MVQWQGAIRRTVLATMASVEMALPDSLLLRKPSLDEEQKPPEPTHRLRGLLEEDEALQYVHQARQETRRAVG